MRRRRINPGDSLNKAISAADWNAMLDLLNHRDSAGLWAPAESGQSPRTTRVPRSSVVWLYNATGSHLPQFSIVGVDGPAVDSSVTYGNFQREVTVSGTTPTNSHRGKFAVTCDAIPAGQCGWACVGGVVQAKVDIDHEDHQFCEVENNNTSSLKSGFAGSAQIVWRKEDSGAGTWCFVRLGNQRTFIRKATADATISAGSSGDVTIQHNSTDSETVTAYYTWADSGLPDIDANDEIWVVWMEDERKWYVLPVVAGSGGTTIPTCVMFNGNSYNGDSSNKNRLIYQGPSHGSNRAGYVHFINGWGDFAGVGCTMLTTASSVGSGTHAYTNAPFKLTQAGLYRFIVAFASRDTSTANAYTTDTLTTSNASAGTAHTHTVDVRREHGRRSHILAALQWQASGGGGWQTTNYQMSGWGPAVTHDSISGTAKEVDIDSPHFVFWQNHNDPNRTYRLQLALFADFDSQLTNVQRDVYADSGLIAITRLADYAADQTLSY